MIKLIAFDVDGTLVPEIPYSWEAFHDSFSIDRKLRHDILLDYFAGNITFEDWGVMDTALWVKKELRKSDFVRVIKHRFTLAHGTPELFHELIQQKYKLAIISGSLSIVLEVLIPDFRNLFTHIFIGHLVFNDNDLLTGFKSGNILKNGKEHKLGELQAVCAAENLDLAQTMFIGDNENDISALQGAGIGVGFMPRSRSVQSAADVVIFDNNLAKILEYL